MSYSSIATKQNFERLRLKSEITAQSIKDARISCESLRDYARSIEQDSYKAIQSKSHPSISVREYGALVQIAQHLVDITIAIKTIEANL